MAFGIETWDAEGNKIMDGSGRHPRVVDVFNPHDLGVPGSRTYPSVSPDSLQAILTQGNRRILTVTVVGTTVSWESFEDWWWSDFLNDGRIMVVSG